MNIALNRTDMYQDVFRARDITSDAMKQAVRLWYELYYQKVPTEKGDPCQQIPYTIIRKLTKTAFSEYKASAKDGFCQRVLDALHLIRGDAMQKSLIGGECLLKPIPSGDSFRFAVVDRNSILVFGRDADGRMTDVGTAEMTVDSRYY